MEIKELIEVAEFCKNNDGTCTGCMYRCDDNCPGAEFDAVIKLRDYYEAKIKNLLNPTLSATAILIMEQQRTRLDDLLKAERSAVIAEVRDKYWHEYFDDPIGFQKWLHEQEAKG